MSLIIFVWVALGLYFVYADVKILKESSPCLMDIAVHELIHDLKESGVQIDVTPQKAENMIIVAMTVMYVIGWPIIVLQRM